ncbi:hypothetical protein BT96DRAFT_981120 [Gymnopus androsaceus JB14]|uniref:Uncharacterized protein n=1 Tax=Gymnopus androsaceus JB14 TaxID=1447944 RepID=A0A6A4GS29_9AGAR|nr:hypothetical protein BT96DRAFT_981120 [Gymnopus androsaceus JB14]
MYFPVQANNDQKLISQGEQIRKVPFNEMRPADALTWYARIFKFARPEIVEKLSCNVAKVTTAYSMEKFKNFGTSGRSNQIFQVLCFVGLTLGPARRTSHIVDLIDKEEVSSIAKSKPKAQVESSDYAVTIVITDDPTHGSVLLISPHYLDADKTNCFGLAEFTFMTFDEFKLKEGNPATAKHVNANWEPLKSFAAQWPMNLYM